MTFTRVSRGGMRNLIAHDGRWQSAVGKSTAIYNSALTAIRCLPLAGNRNTKHLAISYSSCLWNWSFHAQSDELSPHIDSALYIHAGCGIRSVI